MKNLTEQFFKRTANSRILLLFACFLFSACAANGAFTRPDGSIYTGQMKDGEPHGKGTYTWSDGSTYTG
ncbi:MAG: hypothetical protein FWG49_07070, partial [Leptospirales bacterium]|nr:hypothetical protein [Leptospirales bacterium]